MEYNIDKKKLKEVFRLSGRVVRVDIPTDKDGRSRGFAVVEFDHPVEAVQAISMFHNQVLFDRPMTVRMDRANENFKLPDGLKSIGMGLGPNGEPLKNVAHNLPSLANSQQGVGAGILGAVPNNSLQLSNALSGLGNVGASFTNQQLLQAANLNTLASNLLGNSLGVLIFRHWSLSAQNPSFKTRRRSNSSWHWPHKFKPFISYTTSSPQGYNSSNMGAGRGGTTSGFTGSGSFSNDRDLPTTASYKMLHEKFTEYGDVMLMEEKSPGSVLITYGSDWQAERAIKNLDRARIDGRMIDARLWM
ncbi:hypothetical protein NQ317_008456 [Molorchus minor]|uniref:RRM domain-containing protein n=1 Tax=Molorchus minor TaxID=1323400 RepID=A0ABQ9J271_9CUCU|nr:hypothetical protein NQ317_008456 [Molorchus minor]